MEGRAEGVQVHKRMRRTNSLKVRRHAGEEDGASNPRFLDLLARVHYKAAFVLLLPQPRANER